jgi:indolepyruvate ferredoxin oxidoreductase alpha subunit
MEAEMSDLLDMVEGTQHLFMGNTAIARGALEAGVSVAAGYPGTPSSEIIELLASIAGQKNLYVEWATNEKIAAEIAAAASFAGLRSICTMKQNGIHVASDFLLHLTGTGVRSGMVVVVCEDPGALSSQNEADARHFAKMPEGNLERLKVASMNKKRTSVKNLRIRTHNADDHIYLDKEDPVFMFREIIKEG